MSKPRQFWIIDEYPCATWVSSKPLYSADANEEIHVIEFSAYQSAIEELKAARQTIGSLKYGDPKCFCDIAIGNPMVRDHSESCKSATENLKKIDKFLKENE